MADVSIGEETLEGHFGQRDLHPMAANHEP